MKKSKLPLIDVYLVVKNFKCDPNEITKILKVKPSKSWKAGDVFKEKIKHKNST